MTKGSIFIRSNCLTPNPTCNRIVKNTNADPDTRGSPGRQKMCRPPLRHLYPTSGIPCRAPILASVIISCPGQPSTAVRNQSLSNVPLPSLPAEGGRSSATSTPTLTSPASNTITYCGEDFVPAFRCLSSPRKEPSLLRLPDAAQYLRWLLLEHQ